MIQKLHQLMMFCEQYYINSNKNNINNNIVVRFSNVPQNPRPHKDIRIEGSFEGFGFGEPVSRTHPLCGHTLLFENASGNSESQSSETGSPVDWSREKCKLLLAGPVSQD